MTALAAVIPFPMHRIRRRRRVTDVFAPLRDASELERAASRLWWACTGATTLLSVVLQLSLG
jgi:hypothetical protein